MQNVVDLLLVPLPFFCDAACFVYQKVVEIKMKFRYMGMSCSRAP
jgi:hypothetical protein